jgi:hypothetical protein
VTGAGRAAGAAADADPQIRKRARAEATRNVMGLKGKQGTEEQLQKG